MPGPKDLLHGGILRFGVHQTGHLKDLRPIGRKNVPQLRVILPRQNVRMDVLPCKDVQHPENVFIDAAVSAIYHISDQYVHRLTPSLTVTGTPEPEAPSGSAAFSSPSGHENHAGLPF